MNRGPYSYSRLSTFTQCPAKYNWSYVDKVDVERISSPAMERGTKIHNSLEAFVKRETEILHPDIHEHYGQFMFSIRENYECFPESRWAFDWLLRPCAYDEPMCMIRGFMDLKFVPENDNVQVYEYKTGKIYDEHAHQRWIYGVAALLEHPEKKGVDVTTVYLDQKKNVKTFYPSHMLREYKPMLIDEIREVDECEEFIPKPQFLCRWCNFSKQNGGPCSF